MGSEPRLTTLLIDPTTLLLGPSKRTSLQLPPLQDPSPSRTSSRPLPLEPVTSTSKDAQPSTSNLTSHSKAKVKVTNISEPTARHKKPSDVQLSSRPGSPLDRRTLELRRTDVSTDLQSGSGPRKRQRIDGGIGLGEFVQLPKPPQKGKKPPSLPISTPTVVNGLNAPPPSAALFPPITPSSFHDAHGRNALNTTASTLKSTEADSLPLSITEIQKDKIEKKPNTRPRKKWSEEETNDLLQGVAMFGVGSWKKIVAHRSFRFNGRSSVDLKDRFRTCCPEPCRQQITTGRAIQAESGHVDNVTKQRLLDRDAQQMALSDSMSPEKPRTPRSHRKMPEDLARLGIDGPFPKATRRERRPFTKTEDNALLRGYKKHGSAWKLIQEDSSLNLHSRRATDLRDRFRNKYPKEYADAGYVTRPPEFPKPPLRTEADDIPTDVIKPSSPVSGLKRTRKKRLQLIENPTENPTEKDRLIHRTGNVEIPQLASISSTTSSSNINAIANDFTSNNLFTSNNFSNTHNSSTFDWGENILPPPTNDNDPDTQRILGHIHPLATWKASFNPINLIPTSAKPLSTINANINNTKEKTQTSNTLFNTILGTSSNLSTTTSNHEIQKAPLNLPPPTDLFSLDFDSSHPFHFSLKAPDPLKPTAALADNGEHRTTAAETAGGLNLEGQGALTWEDMATHPMFDIDGGGAEREESSGTKL
ncbi:MAG: hypothetical protein M1812_005700 [Candelaria pacifica]|nr:MAG: hypothetical protein M1812_005700 [Candelaria pacifica]